MSEGVKKSSVLLSDGSLKVSYLTIGSGSHHVILMPGALGSAESHLQPLLDHLNSEGNFTLVAWDPPGYGDSRPPERNFTLDFFDQDAKAANELMTQILGITEYSIVGWSDGGITGLVMATLFPQNVKKLILWGAQAFITGKDIEFVEGFRDISKWPDTLRKPMEKMYGMEYLPVLMNKWCDTFKAIYVEREGEIVKSRLDKIRCPTLILHGDKDEIVDPVHPIHMEANIKGAKLHRFPDGTHTIHFQYKEEFIQLVQNFLK